MATKYCPTFMSDRFKRNSKHSNDKFSANKKLTNKEETNR